MGLSDYTKWYITTMEQLDRASAIVDLYYPEIRGLVQEIYGQTNIFWGYQGELLKIKFDDNKDIWTEYHKKVLDASQLINKNIYLLKSKIVEEGLRLNKSLKKNVE